MNLFRVFRIQDVGSTNASEEVAPLVEIQNGTGRHSDCAACTHDPWCLLKSAVSEMEVARSVPCLSYNREGLGSIHRTRVKARLGGT